MELRAGYKKTELGLIPEDWNITTISQISNPVRGGSPRPAGDPKYFNGNFIPWLTVAALTNIPLSEIYVSETSSFLTEEGSLHSRMLDKETLIIANSGATLGVAKLLAIKCCANDGIAALFDFDKETSKLYLAYFINTQIKYLREVVATGNGQPNLNTGLIGNIKVPFPPTLGEQTAIANALSDTDSLIKGLEKIILKKCNIKQGAMQKLLQPKDGWIEKKLGDVGYIVTGSTPSTQIKEYWNGSIPWITPTDISNYQKDIYHSEREISVLGLQVIRKLPANTLLVTCIASIGKNAILRNNGACNQQINAVTPFAENNVDFLYYLMENSKSYLIGKAGITATLMISKKDFSEILYSFPPFEEQIHIANILSDMDNEILALETKLEKYKNVKLGMMQNLLTGKIRLYE